MVLVLVVPANHRVKKKNEKREKTLDIAREQKDEDHEDNTNCNWRSWNCS